MGQLLSGPQRPLGLACLECPTPTPHVMARMVTPQCLTRPSALTCLTPVHSQEAEEERLRLEAEKELAKRKRTEVCEHHGRWGSGQVGGMLAA